MFPCDPTHFYTEVLCYISIWKAWIPKQFAKLLYHIPSLRKSTKFRVIWYRVYENIPNDTRSTSKYALIYLKWSWCRFQQYSSGTVTDQVKKVI